MTRTTSENRPGIVVGVDGSEQSLAALRWAARRARADGTRLRVIHVRPESGTVSMLLPIPLGFAGDIVPGPSQPAGFVGPAVALAAAEAPGVDVTGEVVTGRPEEVLTEMSTDADLVVLGARSTGPLRAPLVTSIGAHVAAHATGPVVVVRGASPTRGPIVLGVDGTEGTASATDFAVEEARRRGLEVEVVHGWAPPPSPGAVAGLATPEVAIGPPREECRRASQALLDTVVADLRERFPDLTVEPNLVAGMPETALLNRSAHATMVVVGSRGRGRIAGTLLGSTSRALVHRADCPVVVARTAEPPPEKPRG